MSGDSGGDRLAAAVAAIGERWQQLRGIIGNKYRMAGTRSVGQNNLLELVLIMGSESTYVVKIKGNATHVERSQSCHKMKEIINQGPVILGQITARELTVHIDRLANIFRYVNHLEAVADAIQKLWPIFKAIFDLCAWDLQTMESLCRACKNAASLLNNDLCYIKLCEFVK